jgi:hypothetical protein
MSASKNLIQAAAGVGGGDFYSYTVDNSVRFNNADSAYLSIPAVTPDSTTKQAFSCWFKIGLPATQVTLLLNRIDSNNYTHFILVGDGTLYFLNYDAGVLSRKVSTAVFRDHSAWYNFVVIVDTTLATASDRIKMYVNGERLTSFGTSADPVSNETFRIVPSATLNNIGRYYDGASFFSYADQYMSQVAVIDGTTVTIDDFGQSKNGVWVPKNLSGLTFGSGGYLLDFSNSAALGTDVSGNGNNFTSSGLTSSDQMTDTPTNNFATANPLDKTTRNAALSEGNLRYVNAVADNNWYATFGSIGMTSGKYYWEICVVSLTTSLSAGIAIGNHSSFNGYSYPFGVETYKVYTNGYIYHDGATTSPTSYCATYNTGDIIGVCVDADAREAWISVNGTFYGSPTAGTGGMAATFGTPFREGDIFPLSDVRDATGMFNFGQDSSFAGNKTAQNNTDENGIGDFYYTPPTGYLALCTANLPEPTIGPNSATITDEVFAPILYTGNATSQSISTLDFQPDLTWIKNRDATDSHMLFDAVRGATKYLNVDLSNNDEATDAQSLSSFDSNGFSVGNNVAVNTNNENYVAWNWKANGSGVTNNDGDVTSTVSVNNDAGISIVEFTTPATAQGFTIGHGMDKAPDFLILRGLQTYQAWWVWHKDFSPTYYYLYLSGTAGFSGLTQSTNAWNNAVPTSTVFSTRSDWQFGTNIPVVGYAFAEVEGFSSFGSYTGNGSADGPFIYTGFRPAFIITKRTDTSGYGWVIMDAGRDQYNVADAWLYADSSSAEVSNSSTRIDFLSNGFKLRGDSSTQNASGGTYIYMAFAENPFKYSNAR